MPRSLRVRLLLAVGLVVVFSVGAVGVLSHFGTRREIERYMEMEMEMETARVVSELPDLSDVAARLQSLHQTGEAWQGALPVLEEAARISDNAGDLALMGPDGSLIATTRSDLDPDSISVSPDGELQILRRRNVDGRILEESGRIRSPWVELRDETGNRIGSVHVLPDLPEELATPEAALLTSVDRWLWVAALVAGVFALALTATVAGRILRPVEQLTLAARNMAAGDLRHRVPVTSTDEVGELALAFNQMADGLERQEQLRQQMVTDVAHDLRTPLTNVRGQLEAIQDGLLQATPEVITSLHEEVLFLGGLVRDLQDLSLADAGVLRLELQAMAIGEEVAKVVDALRPAGLSQGPAIEDAVPDVPEVTADPVRFRQIVRNLLTNALAHTPADGMIRLTAQSVGGNVEVSVRDSGPGIEPAHLPHVFERFYRADGSRDRGTGGAGLGLAIVKKLVQLQGGEVRVESRPGDGAAFVFTLPRAGLSP